MDDFTIKKGDKYDEESYKEVRKIIYDYTMGSIDEPDINWFKKVFFRKYVFHRTEEDWEFDYSWNSQHTREYLVLVSKGETMNNTHLFSEVVKNEILEFAQSEFDWLLHVKRYYLNAANDRPTAKLALLTYFKELKKEYDLYRSKVYGIGELSLFFYNKEFYALDKKSFNFIENEIIKLKEYLSEFEIGNYGTEITHHEQLNTEIDRTQQKPPENHAKDVAIVFEGVKWKERKGSKADLAELIKGLYYMEVIEKDGKKIQLKELQAIFENVFNVSIVDINKSLKSRLESTRNIDNKLFIDNLANNAEIFMKEMAKEIRKDRLKDN